MSEKAILRRLKTVDQLRELCLSLMKAKKTSDEKSKLVEDATVVPRKTRLLKEVKNEEFETKAF